MLTVKSAKVNTVYLNLLADFTQDSPIETKFNLCSLWIALKSSFTRRAVVLLPRAELTPSASMMLKSTNTLVFNFVTL